MFFLFISAMMCITCSNNGNSGNSALTFSVQKIGELPPIDVNQKNKGVAGAFSGILNNKLIVAGGCYFPDKKPWEGGIKIYGTKIYAFELGKDTAQTIPLLACLREPVAYGASITLPEGILCIGGNNPEKCISKVFLMKWEEATSNVILEDYPDLPVPLSLTTAILLDHFVYVTGGSSSPDGKETENHFYRLDLANSYTQAFRWEKLPPYPGIPRILSVAVAQSNGVHKCLYFFGGRNVTNPEKPVVLNDGWMYDPLLQKWNVVKTNSKDGFQVMAGSAFAYGSDNIVFIGGAPDSTYLKAQHLAIALGKATADSNADQIKSEIVSFNNNHQGFSSRIRIFNTLKNSISSGGNFSGYCPVTTCAIPYSNGAIVPCGEIKPGIRTPEIFEIQLNK
jgi:SSS family solute:Na+ symporter